MNDTNARPNGSIGRLPTPMIAMHIVSASSNGLKAAMMGIRAREGGLVERYGGECTLSISVVLFVLPES